MRKDSLFELVKISINAFDIAYFITKLNDKAKLG